MFFKRLLPVFLILCLCVLTGSASALTTAEKEQMYSAAILELETYLENAGNDSGVLYGISGIFDALSGYEQSRFLGYYVIVLQKIASEEYDHEVLLRLDMLDNPGFESYLNNSLKGSAIRPVTELKLYAQARECEHSGQDDRAMELYKQCLQFSDAAERYSRLMEQWYFTTYTEAKLLLDSGRYAEAYFRYQSIERYKDSADYLAAIVHLLGYVPAAPGDTLQPVRDLRLKSVGPDSLTIEWAPSEHAEAYAVYCRRHGAADWTLLGEVTANGTAIRDLIQDETYEIKVAAKSGAVLAESEILSVKTALPTPVPTAPPTPTPEPAGRNIRVGDYVIFGRYEQDVISFNGKEPIEWLVLAVQDGAALLLSRYGLDAHYFDRSHYISARGDYVYPGWADSDIRSWLNSTFLNTAFAQDEQAGILTTPLITMDFTGYHDGSDMNRGAYEYNARIDEWYWEPYGSVSGGRETYDDRVFLLSVAEVETFLPNRDSRKCLPTAYALAQGAGQNTDRNPESCLNGVGCCWWWLRSPFYSELYSARVRFNGTINHSGYGVHSTMGSVRPALWVKCEYLE